jgi:hypothetical protein
MDTFYLVFRVVPIPENPSAKEVEGAFASCWVLADDPAAALILASFKVRQQEWEIVSVEEAPIKVTKTDYFDTEHDLERYKTAQTQGMSLVFAAWAKDGKSSYGPVRLKDANDFVLSDYLSQIKTLKRKGRCLHFDAGRRCAALIDAHSIQKNGALSLIAENGEVYVPSKNFGDTKRSMGGVAFAKQGVGAVSTFRGFCGKHDNELFRPIDDFRLCPTSEQIALYAYRSLCREIFFKENSVLLFKELSEKDHQNKANIGVFDAMYKGSALAFQNLNVHKKKYEFLLGSGSFKALKSALFHSSQPPSVVFSGVLYPEYDFMANQLQDLSDRSKNVDLISFCFAPMSQGWACLFAWHEDSSKSCVPLMRSLATVTHGNESLGDCLFRFVVSNCENLAMNPSRWKSLTEKQRDEVAASASNATNVFSPVRADYLTRGVENITDWKFDYVTSDFEPGTES